VIRRSSRATERQSLNRGEWDIPLLPLNPVHRFPLVGFLIKHKHREEFRLISSAAIEKLQADYEDHDGKLQEVTIQLDAYRVKKAECEDAIAAARSKCDQYSRSDVARLQGKSAAPASIHISSK
jgi:hypothetical protein